MPTENKDVKIFAELVNALWQQTKQDKSTRWTCENLGRSLKKAMLKLPNGFTFNIYMADDDAEISARLYSDTNAEIIGYDKCSDHKDIRTATGQRYPIPPKTQKQIRELYEFVWKNAPWSQTEGLEAALKSVQGEQK